MSHTNVKLRNGGASGLGDLVRQGGDVEGLMSEAALLSSGAGMWHDLSLNALAEGGGGEPPPLVATPFFTDDFNRPNESLETSVNWTLVGGVTGTVVVDTNQLAIAVTTESSFLSPELPSADHYTKMVWQSDVAGSGFLTVRHTDNDNFIGVRFNTQPLPVGWQIYKRVAGTFTSLAEAAQDTPIGKEILIDVRGDNVRLLENDIEVIPFTSLAGAHAGVTTAGVVGRAAITNPWGDSFESGTFE